jgi:hypothetical protein
MKARDAFIVRRLGQRRVHRGIAEVGANATVPGVPERGYGRDDGLASTQVV